MASRLTPAASDDSTRATSCKMLPTNIRVRGKGLVVEFRVSRAQKFQKLEISEGSRYKVSGVRV